MPLTEINGTGEERSMDQLAVQINLINCEISVLQIIEMSSCHITFTSLDHRSLLFDIILHLKGLIDVSVLSEKPGILKLKVRGRGRIYLGFCYHATITKTLLYISKNVL